MGDDLSGRRTRASIRAQINSLRKRASGSAVTAKEMAAINQQISALRRKMLSGSAITKKEMEASSKRRKRRSKK